METTASDVLIIGGGIAGVTTAYYLGQAGVKSLIIERDAVGSHASGFAYGAISSLGNASVHSPTFALATESVRLHRELAKTLPEETRVNIEFRERATLYLNFTDEEMEEAKGRLAWQQKQKGYVVRWLDPFDIRSLEPRVSQDVLGGVHIEGGADLEPYRLMLALVQAAEGRGATVRHGQVTTLKHDGNRIRGVVLENGDQIACEQVVLAMGPWSEEASTWLGIPIPVTPLKGQILRLRAPGPPIQLSLAWGVNYATTKPDGLVWTGSTEEEEGFNEIPTIKARDQIMANLLNMLPSFDEAQLVRQTACLRPLSADRLLVLGKVSGWEGVYIATGAGRQGIALGPAMGKITADLITTGATSIPIDAFDPVRFAS